MLNFAYLKWRERHSQSFDKANITLTKAGQTFNVYDKIQEAREDTEIEPTLKKYGCIDRMILNKEDIYADFTKFGSLDLRDIKEQQKLANNMWQKLPLETRQHFNNDKNIFIKEGEAYIKNLIDEEAKKNQPNISTGKTPVEAQTGVVNNG